jgi:hypothetical protein
MNSPEDAAVSLQICNRAPKRAELTRARYVPWGYRRISL